MLRNKDLKIVLLVIDVKQHEYLTRLAALWKMSRSKAIRKILDTYMKGNI